MERHVVDMQRVVSRRRSCERQRRRDRHAHARTTVTSVENDTRFPSRAAVETTSAPQATVAAQVARTTIDPSKRRGATRRRHATSGEPTPLCERQRRRDRHAHARTTLTSVENDTRFPSRAAVETTSAPRATVAAHVARTTIDPSERREATRRRHATSGEPTPLM